MIGCLIIDDEPLARRKLVDLVAAVPWLTCVGEAGDGVTAIRLVDATKPDLLFLDIRMPGLTGLDVLERVHHQPAVIFTTAHDGYAVAAFELLALDFLLKPFSADRFHRSIARLQPVLSQEFPLSLRERAGVALGHEPLTRVIVRDAKGLISMPLADVERIEGYDDYSALYSRGRRYLLSRRLGELELVLTPANFLRIHRSHLVNVAHIVAATRQEGGRFEVTLRNGYRVTSSRARGDALRAAIAPLLG